MFGISKANLSYIVGTIKKFDEIKEARIFGSRAKGNYKKGSDIDIVIYGDFQINTVSELKYILDEESCIPYFFDVIHYNRITDEQLKKSIDKNSVVIYKE